MGKRCGALTRERNEQDPHYVQELRTRLNSTTSASAQPPPGEFEAFINDPLSSWIESTFGLAAEPGSGRLRRAQPMSIGGEEGAAAKLAQLTGVTTTACATALQAGLLAGYQVGHPETHFPVFAFRLHQFISRGDTVYATLDDPGTRFITTHAQQYVPRDRGRVLLPLVFCRECGQEYYGVQRVPGDQTGAATYVARQLTDQANDDKGEPGFLYANPNNPWPENLEGMAERLPEDWLVADRTVVTVRRDRQKNLPQSQHINLLGEIDVKGSHFHFVKSPFAFCLNCGVSYDARQRSDYGKLASLSSEGRSTATTVLSLAALRALRLDETLERKARKLLSFTDNRQDASLQAGHFNDFVEVSLLRSAIYKAVADAGDEGLTDESLPSKVFAALSLPFDLYAVDATVLFAARNETERALREVLAYRVYQDLRRGWRVTSPNLEQVGLLRIEYKSLADLCAYEDIWKKLHPALADATPETLAKIAKTLLDYLRRELAIKVDYLESDYQEKIQQRSSQRLKEPWALDEEEVMVHASIAFPRSRIPNEIRENIFISAWGALAPIYVALLRCRTIARNLRWKKHKLSSTIFWKLCAKQVWLKG